MFNKKNVVVRECSFSGAHDPSMCVSWANEFLNNKISLEKEIDEVRGTISNERMWEKGADDNVAECHTKNILNLRCYLAWLESFL